MVYIHRGKILDNGAVDTGSVITDPGELKFRPEDDGRQITDYVRGDFEWWYFDIWDLASGCFIKLVVHIGTNPLRTRIISQAAASLSTPEKSKSYFYPFSMNEMKADTIQCDISVGDKISIRRGISEQEYLINADIHGFKCNFRFTGEIEGWKPFGRKIQYASEGKRGDFSWVVPVPRARVEGYFMSENKEYKLIDAVGYHDHNYIRVDRDHPLYLDALANKWYWGKCYTERYTVLFADVHSRSNRILTLMVADNGKIIHSSNNLIDLSVIKTGYDGILRMNYPASIRIKSLDEKFPFLAEIEFNRMLDRRDLLEGITPVMKFMIKLLIARPVYHGILAKTVLEINNERLQGSGNFESMVFRGT